MMKAKFHPGQVIYHRLFGYRGVVVDVDAVFSGTDAWYQAMAVTRPEREQPWYHLLVDGAEAATYVPEEHLLGDASGEPVDHPLLENFFSAFRPEHGAYCSRHSRN
ncbi:MAG: heat shock protein HspQ [Ectothiorhodospiraceae bacterium]|nr:heat shock protein HspQ [Ectothiorhodospiraceae bacterium]